MRKNQKETIERLAKLKFTLKKQLKAYKDEQNSIFAGAPERKVVNITPTLHQLENSHMVKESAQNERYLAIIMQKQEIIVRRLIELERVKPEDFDESADIAIREQIAHLEAEELWRE